MRVATLATQLYLCYNKTCRELLILSLGVSSPASAGLSYLSLSVE